MNLYSSTSGVLVSSPCGVERGRFSRLARSTYLSKTESAIRLSGTVQSRTKATRKQLPLVLETLPSAADCSATRGKPFEHIAACHPLSTRTVVPIYLSGTGRGARRTTELHVRTENHAPAKIGIRQSTRADAGEFKAYKRSLLEALATYA